MGKERTSGRGFKRRRKRNLSGSADSAKVCPDGRFTAAVEQPNGRDNNARTEQTQTRNSKQLQKHQKLVTGSPTPERSTAATHWLRVSLRSAASARRGSSSRVKPNASTVRMQMWQRSRSDLRAWQGVQREKKIRPSARTQRDGHTMRGEVGKGQRRALTRTRQGKDSKGGQEDW